MTSSVPIEGLLAAIDLPDAEVAETLGVSADVVAAWRSGTLKLGGLELRRLAWLADHRARERAVAEAGIPGCEAFEGLEERLDLFQPQSVSALVDHMDRCPDCLERREFIEANFPPAAAYPEGGIMGVVRGFRERAERLPGPLGAAVQGGALLTILVAFAALPAMFSQLTAGSGPVLAPIEDALVALGMAFLAGAAVGGVVSGARRLLRGRW